MARSNLQHRVPPAALRWLAVHGDSQPQQQQGLGCVPWRILPSMAQQLCDGPFSSGGAALRCSVVWLERPPECIIYPAIFSKPVREARRSRLENLWAQPRRIKQLSTLDGCHFERLVNLTLMLPCRCCRATLHRRLVSLKFVSFKAKKAINLPLTMASAFNTEARLRDAQIYFCHFQTMQHLDDQIVARGGLTVWRHESGRRTRKMWRKDAET